MEIEMDNTLDGERPQASRSSDRLAPPGLNLSASMESLDDIQRERDIMETIMTSLGHGSITNHLTYRSFVDPQEARPDPAYYDGGRSTQSDAGRKRSNFADLQSEEFNLTNLHAVYEEKSSTATDYVEDDEDAQPIAPNEDSTKFGVWDGVFTSCLLNIFGVIMFLRLGWVVGQAGIPLALLIITIATVVTTITSLSMSAIATNGEVREGGAYYLISRSIGPRIGGSIGLLFSIGMSVAVSLYVIGFCETLVEQLPTSLTGDELNDTRIYGLILNFIIFTMAYIGVDWVIKLQVGLLILLCMSILSFIIGSFYTTGTAIPGIDSGVASDNATPNFTRFKGVDYDFFSVFAVFFPAVTGIMAGANISGDLRNPSEAIPRGTLWSIFVSYVVYCLMAILIGCVADAEIVGEDPPESGLLYDTLIMVKVSAWGPLVLAGIYAATFSSALASLVGAPRVLQRLAADGIVPFLNPFTKVRDSDGAPIRGYILTLLVASGCVLIGELNQIAPLITMFFMMTYALINFSTFALDYNKSPAWRPTFRHFNLWVSLFGCVLCIVIMFLTSIIYAVVALAVGFALYKYVEYQDVQVNWGSAGEARLDLRTTSLLMDMRRIPHHVKTFRPHYLVLTGKPETRLHLVDFVDTLSLGHGSVILGNVIEDDFNSVFTGKREDVDAMAQGYWESKTKNFAAFHQNVVAQDFRSGCQSLMQLVGLGRITPNTLIIGFKENWTHNPKDTAKYVDVIRDAFRLHMGVMICRNMQSIDFAAKPDPEGTIDAWWLIDDGGLTVLICYIISMHSFWKAQTKQGTERAAVRMLIVVKSDRELMVLYQIVGNMLKNFRIEWDVIVVRAGTKSPAPAVYEEYEKFAGVKPNDTARPLVTKRWLRVGELMREHSQDAKLVVCVCPFPRDHTNDREYMTIIEMLSKDMPPMVLMRGTGQNVLTGKSE